MNCTWLTCQYSKREWNDKEYVRRCRRRFREMLSKISLLRSAMNIFSWGNLLKWSASSSVFYPRFHEGVRFYWDCDYFDLIKGNSYHFPITVQSLKYKFFIFWFQSSLLQNKIWLTSQIVLHLCIVHVHTFVLLCALLASWLPAAVLFFLASFFSFPSKKIIFTCSSKQPIK